MNTALWILQGLIAAMFAMAGIMKLGKSRDDLMNQKDMSWVESVSTGNIKLIGLLELLAAVGLIVPQLTGILPWMTPSAALGLVLTMAGAMVLHVKRGDGMKMVSRNIMLMLLAGFIALGRFLIVPV
jgi:uncharacterized membrane protein YphA (DoxX/SURF4 family)